VPGVIHGRRERRLPAAVREAVAQVPAEDALSAAVRKEVVARPARVPAEDALPVAVRKEVVARPARVPTEDARRPRPRPRTR
jgi:hypothetical protein